MTHQSDITLRALENWRDMKFGMFIHFGVYSMLGGEWKGEKVPGLGGGFRYWAMSSGATGALSSVASAGSGPRASRSPSSSRAVSGSTVITGVRADTVTAALPPAAMGAKKA